MPEQKKKVIFNYDGGWVIHHLVLTESQIRLLRWAISNGYIDNNRVTIDILDDCQD